MRRRWQGHYIHYTIDLGVFGVLDGRAAFGSLIRAGS